MKTLTSSLSKAIIDVHGDRAFSCYNDLSRAELCLFLPKKLVRNQFLPSLSLKYKHLQPISASSLPPDSEVGSETAETEAGEGNTSKTSHVKFQLQRECSFGEQFLIVGDHPMFGSWDPERAISMTWSEGHVWTVELDVPVEKSIQFKFVLKTRTGNLVWQPGPDRNFKSWETEKTIIVFEDWEEAQNQKVMEEEPLSNHGAVLDSEMALVAGNTTPAKDILISDTEKLVSNVDSLTNPEKEKLLALTQELATGNGAPSLEKPLTIVAENITEGFIENANNGVLDVKRTNYRNDEASTGHKNISVAKGLGNISRADTFKNPAPADTEGNLVAHQGSPVLAPGLPPSATVLTEEAMVDEEEKISTIDASIGVDEAKYRNFPELEEKKQEPEDEPQEENTIAVSMDEEAQLDNQQTQKPQLAIEEQPAPSQSNNVLQNDAKWGRKTLQKLLNSLSFLSLI